jgi:hypothetical protein
VGVGEAAGVEGVWLAAGESMRLGAADALLAGESVDRGAPGVGELCAAAACVLAWAAWKVPAIAVEKYQVGIGVGRASPGVGLQAERKTIVSRASKAQERQIVWIRSIAGERRDTKSLGFVTGIVARVFYHAHWSRNQTGKEACARFPPR